jgi:hypothetical protein
MRRRFAAKVRACRVPALAASQALACLGCGADRTLYIGAHETDAALETDGSGGTGTDAGSPAADCDPLIAPPSDLAAQGFYAKYTLAAGIPVMASEAVDDEAVLRACSIALQMVSTRPELAEEMVRNGAKVVIIDEDQRLTELPEFARLGPEWDDERGAGATLQVPTTGAAEENLLCLASDRYDGENLLVHAFAHAVRGLGIRPLEDDFDARLSELYDSAIGDGKWQDTYAASSAPQYWAEGVQSWFAVNLASDPPDGIHNQVNTPEELSQYDPGLYALIAEYFIETLSLECL